MYESELKHYGVKGMKWGVRRYQNKDGTLTAEGRAKYGGDITQRKTKHVKAQVKAGIRSKTIDTNTVGKKSTKKCPKLKNMKN